MYHLSITHNHKEQRNNYRTPRAQESHWFNRRQFQQGREKDETKFLHMSLNKKRASDIDRSPDNKNTGITRGQQIYFSRTKKYNYMRQIIDKYFDQTRNENKSNNPQDLHQSLFLSKPFQTIIPKITKSIYLSTIDKSRNIEHKNQRKHVVKRQRAIQKRNIEINHQDEDEGLELIQENKTPAQDQRDEKEIQMTRSVSFSKKDSLCLPPIDETYEDKDEYYNSFESISLLNESISCLNESSHHEQCQQQKILLVRNEIFTVQLVKRSGKPSHILKTYQDKGMPILMRQKKARELGVQSIWIQYKYDQQALISKPGPNLKDRLFRAQKMDANSKFYTLKPKRYHKKLLANRCQQLKRVVKQLCLTLKQYEGRVVNNKINTSNLYLANNQNWKVGEWGFSSFRASHLIQGMEFENRLDPILKSQSQWFIPPEYMAPQIMKAVSLNEQCDLMSFGSAPDVWALGVTIFQIFSLIPVWIVPKCVVHGKIMPARSGLLAVGNRDLKKMLKRQAKLSYLMGKIIQEQCQDIELDPSLVEAMYKCVSYDPSDRPSYDELLQIIN